MTVGVRIDLPVEMYVESVDCQRCGIHLMEFVYVWPEQESVLWATQCGVCGYVWHRVRGRG